MRRVAGGIAVLIGLLLAAPAAPALSAEPGELDGFEYVALGDSYSAGFGLIPFSATSPFAATPPTDANGCYQADANYPHLVASALGLAVDDQTCSGAVAANVGYPGGTTLPTPPTPTPSLLPALSATSQVQQTMTGQTALQLQTAALSASTDVVTFAIGGNDLGFADIAEACIRLTNTGSSTDYATGLQFLAGIQVNNCREVFDGSDPTYADFDLVTRLQQYVVPRIEAVLDEIATRAPNAQVFVVGYPRIATGDPAKANACFTSPLPPATNAVPFSGADILFIHEIEGLLDDALEAGASAHGFHFVSSAESTGSHALCETDPWISGLTVAYPSGGVCPTDYQPLGQDGNVYVCVELGALHPNASGVANLASLVAPAVDAAFGTSLSVGSVAPEGRLTVSGVGFRPGEQVEVVLHSTPATLGTFTAGASGAFSAAVTIPADAAAGAHTVVSTGLASGRAFSAALTVELAATGSDPLAPLLLGLCLVTTGFLFVSARRRRPSAPAR
ncbi:MAG: hypothetical protein BGO95_08635 [Micrococcales bacterium 73-13]|nr:MAG: hypothetical protein BGO95_08635 [Micrococcales bacterium 73-13]